MNDARLLSVLVQLATVRNRLCDSDSALAKDFRRRRDSCVVFPFTVEEMRLLVSPIGVFRVFRCGEVTLASQNARHG